MAIFLGNLSIDQIAERCGIDFSTEDRNFMAQRREQSAQDIAPHKWHEFDIPLSIMCGSKEFAILVRDKLEQYDWSHCKEVLNITWSLEK